MIKIKTKFEIEKIRRASLIVARTLELVKINSRPGISLDYLDAVADEFITSCNARASFKGLYGFPKSVCLSVNDVIIHGIPNDYVLKEGDILGVDVGVEYDGWYGDAAITFGIGDISHFDNVLIETSSSVLDEAIKNIRVGMYFKELSKILQDLIIGKGFFAVVRILWTWYWR